MQNQRGDTAHTQSKKKKILIANRGEIACRIVATARRMGIRTVAVYSDADIDARHVALADEACRIGPPAAAESYLSIDKIIEACRATAADAVHPGYGFLSENPDFVEALDTAGITFIGPSAAAIRAMGLKDAAKALMERSGVPVVPGYHGEDQDPDLLVEHAEAIGYPVLIKARAGGGGKGMRRVDDHSEFHAALESAAREAEASFGDGRCLIEKYLTKPRHIEIQIFGDCHGQIVYLFERDCSLQRRHQKVIEEAPAPGMSDEMRAAMGEAAVRAAEAIGYQGAGTIEFIADVSDGLRADRFFFMEMNTRLQVEHPVTEAITGQDLVEWQIRVAAGEPLPVAQDDLAIDGWAFEARIYAEDVPKGFLPATGKLDVLALPEDDARVDKGVRQGDEITPFYDPMIAKVIVHGESRDQALGRLSKALAETRVVGTTTNVDFLAKLAAHPDFAKGAVDTGLIDRHLDELIETPSPTGEAFALAALAALSLLPESASTGTVAVVDPWDRQNGWRLWGTATQFAILSDGEHALEIPVSFETDGTYRIETPAGPIALSHVEVDGIDVRCRVGDAKVTAGMVRHGSKIAVFIDGQTHRWTIPDLHREGVDADALDDRLRAPMPGLIKLVHAQVGESVSKGMPLVVMEAMKMEHTLKAPRDGIVERTYVDVGDQVEEGTALLELEPELDEENDPSLIKSA